MVRVLGIGGSMRGESSAERALRISAAAAEDAGATVELITGRALALPIYDPDAPCRTAPAAALIAALRGADAVLIASPAYHGTISGMLKNALDYAEDLRGDDRPYLSGVPVGCIAVGEGWQASVTTLTTLRTCAHALRGWPSPLGAALHAAYFDEAARSQLETIGRQVVEFAVAQRAAVPSGEET